MSLKAQVDVIVGVIGGVATYMFGGWNAIMQTLVLVMIIDYLTGIIKAGVFKKSTKTKNGALSSKAGCKGLAKKVVTILLIVVCYRMDIILNLNGMLYHAVTFGFIANEVLSIVENCTAMGIPIPEKLKDAIEMLKGE